MTWETLLATAMHGGCNYFAVQVHYFVTTLVVTIQSLARRWTENINTVGLALGNRVSHFSAQR